MSWCPRCDTIRPGDAGDECFECGADLLEAAVLGRPTKARNHVLELEREEAPAADAQEADAPIETRIADAPPLPRRRFGSARIVAGLLVVAVAAGASVFIAERHHPKHGSAPLADSTRIGSPSTQTPPFGTPVQGRLVFVTGTSLVELDLTSGAQNTVHTDGGIGSYRPSPDSSVGAYIDDHQTLWVMSGIATEQRRAIATGVQGFTWMRGLMPGTMTLLIVRAETDLHGGQRTRIESIDAQQGMTLGVLYEGTRGVTSILATEKRIIVGADSSDGTGTYVVDGGRLRLVRAGYMPMALSPDDDYVLAIRQGEGGQFGFSRLDLDTRRVHTIGSDALTPSAVTFAGDGTAVAYDGGGALYRIYPATGKAVRLKAATREFIGAPILLSNGRWLYVGRRPNDISFEIGPQTFTLPFDAVNDIADVQYVPA